MYSVSWHIGDKFSQGHNRRDNKIIDKEPHIDKNGFHETLIDIDIKEAYKQKFEAALNEYNERIKSKHPERVKTFNQYYNNIKNSKNANDKKLCYELILQVGNAENAPNFNHTYNAYVQYLDSFQKNNKDMFVCGAYIHFDEKGGGHMHIDFIPCAECDRGMKLQNSMNAVLKKQGFKSNHKNDSALIAWQKRERETFKDICRSLGLEVQNSKPDKREHISKEDYISMKQMQNKIKQIKNDLNRLIALEKDILGYSSTEEKINKSINIDCER